ncbi:MAG: DNA repair exonuclease [Spirochaetales bacterium]|nr:DNA repair exonuclease [Spirochaetales bacterium]
MKIFATADLHLGMKFSTFDDIRGDLSRARFGALERCVKAANDEKCDLFVVAGDLFDRQNISGNDINRAAALLSRFEGAALLILPGNHDFYTGAEGKPWGDFVRELESASSPVVMLSNPQAYDLDHFDLQVTVFPGPCTAKHSAVDNISWVQGQATRQGGDMKRLLLGVAHGSVEGLSPDFNGEYYPMTMKQLEDSPIELWIIGHTHRPYPAEGTVNPLLFIPGAPEPDGFDCRHEGGGWVLECSGAKLESYKRISTGAYRFYEKRMEVEDVRSIGKAFEDAQPESSLVSLTLSGALDRQEYSKLQPVLKELKERYFYCRVNLDGLEEIVGRETVEDEFAPGSFPHRLIGSFLEGGDTDAAQIAYRLIRETGP